MTTPSAALWLVGPNRPQEIFTPLSIIDRIHKEFGHIALDPCAAECKPDWTRADAWDTSTGLDIPWPDKTYFNPPYKYLRVWLEKAAGAAGAIAGLFPVRSHRRWYRKTLKGTRVVELNPLVFHGYKTPFPAPLVVAFWNHAPDPRVWEDIGELRPDSGG